MLSWHLMLKIEHTRLTERVIVLFFDFQFLQCFEIAYMIILFCFWVYPLADMLLITSGITSIYVSLGQRLFDCSAL